MRSIIADSGFWLALANPNDKHHQIAIHKAEEFTDPLITTWPVFTEVCYLLMSRIGHHSQMKFIQNYIDNIFSIFDLHSLHGPIIKILMEKYKSLPMDFADASLNVLAEELGHGRIFSTDERDFNTYRWKNHHPFENLLLYS